MTTTARSSKRKEKWDRPVSKKFYDHIISQIRTAASLSSDINADNVIRCLEEYLTHRTPHRHSRLHRNRGNRIHPASTPHRPSHAPLRPCPPSRRTPPHLSAVHRGQYHPVTLRNARIRHPISSITTAHTRIQTSSPPPSHPPAPPTKTPQTHP